jgi:hypothetical protein
MKLTPTSMWSILQRFGSQLVSRLKNTRPVYYGLLADVPIQLDPTGEQCAAACATMLLHWLIPMVDYTVNHVHICIQGHLPPGLNPVGGVTPEAVKAALAQLAPGARVYHRHFLNRRAAELGIATQAPFIAFISQKSLVDHIFERLSPEPSFEKSVIEAHCVVVLGRCGEDVSIHNPTIGAGGGPQQPYNLRLFLRNWRTCGYCTVGFDHGNPVGI